MQTFVLVGSPSRREAYIKHIILANSLQDYHIIRFETRVKIQDVRKLQSILSLKLEQGGKRLVILPIDITPDAQHALLKTLEEVPEGYSIYIHGDLKDGLLPTILSRSQIVQLRTEDQSPDMLKEYERVIREYMLNASSFTLERLFILEDVLTLSQPSTQFNMGLFIVALRNTVKVALISRNQKYIQLLPKLFMFLKELIQVYPILIHNNVQQRIALEACFIHSFIREIPRRDQVGLQIVP